MRKDLQIPSHYSDKRLAQDGGKFIYDGELSSILNVSRCIILTYGKVCMLVIMDIYTVLVWTLYLMDLHENIVISVNYTNLEVHRCLGAPLRVVNQALDGIPMVIFTNPHL